MAERAERRIVNRDRGVRGLTDARQNDALEKTRAGRDEIKRNQQHKEHHKNAVKNLRPTAMFHDDTFRIFIFVHKFLAIRPIRLSKQTFEDANFFSAGVDRVRQKSIQTFSSSSSSFSSSSSQTLIFEDEDEKE